MKTKKYYLTSVVAVGILCVTILRGVDLPPPADEPTILLGQPNPALAGIDKLYVRIAPHGFEPNSHGLVFEELENAIIDRLKEAGITIAETDIDKMEPNSTPAKMATILKRRIDPANVRNLKFRPSRIPELRVDIDTLDIEHSQQVVFHIQISLARLVHLEKENRLAFKTDVWKSEPIMQAVSAKSTPAAVTNVALGQVEAFIHAYLAANSPTKRPSDANDVSKVAKEQVEPAAKSTPAEYKYVASKNSEVFHKPDCSWAKRIKRENLIGYSSRDEAINAGKRPCSRCNP